MILFFGSLVSIFVTRSFALLEMVGQGSDSKSISPLRMQSKIFFSVSAGRPAANGSEDMRGRGAQRRYGAAGGDLTGPEERHAAEEDVEDDPSAPDVDFLPIRAQQDLGSHVVGAPHYLPVHLP